MTTTTTLTMLQDLERGESEGEGLRRELELAQQEVSSLKQLILGKDSLLLRKCQALDHAKVSVVLGEGEREGGEIGGQRGRERGRERGGEVSSLKQLIQGKDSLLLRKCQALD